MNELQAQTYVSEVLNILVLDDNRGDRLLCRTHLLRVGSFECEVFEAASGEEAITIARRIAFDCVFADQYLPDGLGLDFIESIRGGSGDADLPVVLLTGKGDEALAVEALQRGATDYLPKNKLSCTALDRVLNNALEKAHLRRRLKRKKQMLVETNRALQKSNHEIREFYQTVSHELKTPLTAIREYASLILEGVAGDVSEKQQDFLVRSVECCDHLTRIINDLLDTAKVETGKLNMEFSSTDFERIARNCHAELLRPAQQKDIELKLDIRSKIPNIQADADRIEQALTNLVTNAIRYTPQGGHVEIIVRHDALAESVCLDVKDDGVGIAWEDQGSIFDRYQQIKADEKGFKEGMGIGLFLTARIAELHGGAVTVQSDIGRGSIFTLTVPVDVFGMREGEHS